MRWLYNTRKRTLRQLKHNSNEITLSARESELLLILANNVINTYFEIYSHIERSEIRYLKRELVDKTGLKIRTVTSVGYILEDEIYIL